MYWTNEKRGMEMAKYKVTNEAKREIAEELKRSGIAYWQLAAALGLHENTVSKWMRMPTAEQAASIRAAIRRIKAG